MSPAEAALTVPAAPRSETARRPVASSEQDAAVVRALASCRTSGRCR